MCLELPFNFDFIVLSLGFSRVVSTFLALFTPLSLNTSTNTFASHRLFNILGTIHSLDSPTNVTLFNFGQFLFILVYISGILFHTSWSGNFEPFVNFCTLVTLYFMPLGIAHRLFDPHFGPLLASVYNFVVTSTSGIYNIFFSLGFRSSLSVSTFSLNLLFLCLLGCIYGRFCIGFVLRLDSSPQLGFVTLSCLFWTFHGIVVVLPFFWGEKSGLFALWTFFEVFFSGMWSQLVFNPDLSTHIYGSFFNIGSSILSTSVAVSKTFGALLPTILVHHHLAISIMLAFLVSLSTCITCSFSHTSCHFSYYSPFPSAVPNSIPLQLSLFLGLFGLLSAFTGCNIYLYNPYAFFSYDFPSVVCNYTHHYYISALCMLVSLVHVTVHEFIG